MAVNYGNDGVGYTKKKYDSSMEKFASSRSSYNEELERVNSVISNREDSDMDISNQQNYLTQLQDVAPQGSQEFGAMKRLLRQNSDAQFATQESKLDSTLEQQIADLERSYQSAVADGEISVRDAERNFADNKQTIQQNAYQQSQSTNLEGESRGIQNSQQMIGLQQGDNQRTNSMINENMTKRDQRVSDVKDRIANIKNSKNLDVTSATAQHGYAVAGARGEADAQYAQNMFDVTQENFIAERNLGMDFQRMDKQQVQVLEQMATQQGYDLAKMSKQEVIDLAKMAKQQGYNIDLTNLEQKHTQTNMSTQQGYDRSNMATQQGYDRANIASKGAQDRSTAAARGAQNRKTNAANTAKDDGFDKALSRKAVSLGLSPNASSYQVAQAESRTNRDNSVADQDAMNKATSKSKANEAKALRYEEIIAKPITPAKSGFFGFGKPSYDEERRYAQEVFARRDAQQKLNNLFK